MTLHLGGPRSLAKVFFFLFFSFDWVKCNLIKLTTTSLAFKQSISLAVLKAVHELSVQAVHKLSGHVVHELRVKVVQKLSGQVLHELNS